MRAAGSVIFCASTNIFSSCGLHQKLEFMPPSTALALLNSGPIQSLGSGKSIHQPKLPAVSNPACSAGVVGCCCPWS